MSRDKWTLTDETYEYVKGEATHILVKYNINCVPVSGFEVAIKLGMKLIPYSTLDQEQLDVLYNDNPDGLLLVDASGIGKIYYNDIDWDYERINMTILHEVGHYVLDHTGDSKNWEEEEAEAKFFAKYIISPPVVVDIIGAVSPDDIYQNFDVSMEVAWYNFSYYLSWLRLHRARGNYTEYEKLLLGLYKSQRKEAICER